MGTPTSERWKNSYSPFPLMLSPPNLTTASFTLGEVIIPTSSHYIFIQLLHNHQIVVHTQIEKAPCFFYTLVVCLMKIGGSSYSVYKKLFDSMVAPVLDYRVPVWYRFCSLRKYREGIKPTLQVLAVSSKHQWQLHLEMCWMPTPCRH